MSLAVATMATAVAIEALVLGSTALSGGVAGRKAPRPDPFGDRRGHLGTGGPTNSRSCVGFVALGVLVATAVAVANLRRNRTGLRWLAVRANERAGRGRRASTWRG